MLFMRRCVENRRRELRFDTLNFRGALEMGRDMFDLAAFESQLFILDVTPQPIQHQA
jgi:hypothetical protein